MVFIVLVLRRSVKNIARVIYDCPTTTEPPIPLRADAEGKATGLGLRR